MFIYYTFFYNKIKFNFYNNLIFKYNKIYYNKKNYIQNVKFEV